MHFICRHWCREAIWLSQSISVFLNKFVYNLINKIILKNVSNTYLMHGAPSKKIMS